MKNFLLGLTLTGVLVSFSFLKEKNNIKEIRTITKFNVDTLKIYEPKTSKILSLSDIAKVSKIKTTALSSKVKNQNFTVKNNSVSAAHKRVYNFSPMNNLNMQIAFWDVEKIREDMSAHQFKNLEGLNINELKEIRMAYYYDKLLWDVHEKTGLGLGVIWAFLRIEAFNGNINESWLLQTAWNFGGIKYRKNIHKNFVLAKDDCGSQKCKFAKFNSYEEGMKAWASVFNSPRYKNCKSQKSTFAIFNCIYKGGYHSHNNVQTRKKLCERYWTLRKHFPG